MTFFQVSIRILSAFLLIQSVAGAKELPAFYKHIDQIVWVVKNLDGTLSAWKELGLGDVHEVSAVTVQEKDAGAKQQAALRAAKARLGKLSVLFIQTETGTGPFAAFAAKHGDGIFAIVYNVESHQASDDETARLNALGVGVLAKVNFAGATYTFFDTEREGKYVLGISPGPVPSSQTSSSPVEISHIAPVIRDAAPVSAFWASLGFPAFTIGHATPRDDSRYRGQPLLLSFDVGWQRQAQLTYEWIIPPSSPPNIYADFLAKHGEGIQHLGVPVENLPEAIERYRKLGYTAWQSGAWGDVGQPHSGQYAYMDTDRIGGVIVELIHAY